jgi:CRP-like cAMP-binding protein
MTELLQSLRGMRLMQTLPEACIEQIAQRARLVEFASGDVLFRQGDAAVDIFLVIQGNVALEICAPGIGCKRILTVSDGDLLGWSPLLPQLRLTATARALSEGSAVAINGYELTRLFEQEPRFGFEFMRRIALALAQRLNATRLQLLDVYGSQMIGVTDERAAP